MALVVGVHGIGNEYRGEAVMHSNWFPAMLDGLRRAGAGLDPADLICAFYGDVFRPASRTLSSEIPWYEADDVRDEIELGLLETWWEHAARHDTALVGPDERTLARTPRSVQRALDALSNSKFFAGIAERAMIFSLKQVRNYFTDEHVRKAAIERVADAVGTDTRVLVGHSLGSVVAYEALCAHPEWPVHTLVTLGSPLGIRNLVFDRLRPSADEHGLGRWPGSAAGWANIVDDGDIVALRKDLRPLFGDRVSTMVVHCGARAHDATRYLTSEATGHVIAAAIRHA